MNGSSESANLLNIVRLTPDCFSTGAYTKSAKALRGKSLATTDYMSHRNLTICNRDRLASVKLSIVKLTNCQLSN